MIVLSAGMPRAGSGWYYNLTNDLMISAGYQDGRVIRERYHLQRILTEVNCNIGALSIKRLLPVLVPSILGNTYVIKTHAAPTSFTHYLIQHRILVTAYIYRDPRDAMLSAYEYGRRGKQKGRLNAFSYLTDFKTSLEFIMKYVHIWEQWTAFQGVLYTRYEDLKSNFDQEVMKLVDILGIDKEAPATQKVIDKYRPGQAFRELKGTHFSKGISGRFRDVYTEEEQEILNEKLGGYLAKMGYEK